LRIQLVGAGPPTRSLPRAERARISAPDGVQLQFDAWATRVALGPIPGLVESNETRGDTCRKQTWSGFGGALMKRGILIVILGILCWVWVATAQENPRDAEKLGNVHFPVSCLPA